MTTTSKPERYSTDLLAAGFVAPVTVSRGECSHCGAECDVVTAADPTGTVHTFFECEHGPRSIVYRADFARGWV